MSEKMSAHNKNNGEPTRTLRRSLRPLNKKNKEPAEGLPTNKRARKDKNVESKPIFPLDVFIEILSWLPVDYLLQVQLVCKEWQAIIHDRYFLEKQMAHTSVHYIVINRLYKPTLPLRQPQLKPEPGLDSKLKRFQMSYTGGCDGLVMCVTSQILSGSGYTYLLWNPAIHRVLELPRPSEGCSYGYAFRYILSSKTYMIVRFYIEYPETRIRCEVLTPGPSMSWRQLTLPDIYANEDPFVYFNSIGRWDRSSIVSAGGDVHCVVVNKVGTEFDIKIASLDVGTECFTVNCLPNGVFEYMGNLVPLEWDGKLAFANVAGENLELIELENYEKWKWSEKRIIRLHVLKGGVEEKVYRLLNKHGEVWFFMDNYKILPDNDAKVFAYSIGMRKMTEVHFRWFRYDTKIYPYRSSLVCIEGMVPDTFLSLYRPNGLK